MPHDPADLDGDAVFDLSTGSPLTPLPADDPAYGDVLDVLALHGGETLNTHADMEGGRLFSDLLAAVVADRVRNSGPADIVDFFAALTPEQRAELVDTDEASEAQVSVITDVSPTGVYVVTVQYDEDHSRTLKPDEVGPYCDALMTAVVYAEYDAAVLAYLRDKLSPGASNERDAAQVVVELRQSRLAIDQKALRPLIAKPCVSASSGLPYIGLRLAGTAFKWQWSPADVVSHTQFVREAVFAADMDATYRRVLVTHVGLSDQTARAAVGELHRWRHPRS